jgi:hypothetical protein
MANRAHEHPELRVRVNATLTATAGFAKLVSSSRTHAEQAALFKKFKEGRGNLAANPDRFDPKTGRRGSNHQVQDDGNSYAVDITVRAVSDRKRLEIIANSHGLIRTVPSEYWHFELIGPNGRAHRFGDAVPSWTGRAGELDRGDVGPEVEHLQLLLIRAAVLEVGEDDGEFGRKTEDAVRLLQQRLAIAPVTGRWDAQTENLATETFGSDEPEDEGEDRVRYWLMKTKDKPEVFIVAEDFSTAKHVPNEARLADVKQLALEASTEILNGGEIRVVSDDFISFVLGKSS